MIKKLTVDSSVIISSLLAKEPRHKEARKIWESVLSGNNLAILPYSVLVEVTAAAVRRRTGSEQLALQVKEELLGNPQRFSILHSQFPGPCLSVSREAQIVSCCSY